MNTLTDALWWHFSVSGAETWVWLPPLVALVISFFSSMVGISGAFLLMPFQMSFLVYVAPSVSATNLVFNLYATPGGVWRYALEGRMSWPLARLIVLGTLPGMVLGLCLRALYLPDAGHFKMFVGVVLLYLSWRLLARFAPWPKRTRSVGRPGAMALRVEPRHGGDWRLPSRAVNTVSTPGPCSHWPSWSALSVALRG